MQRPRLFDRYTKEAVREVLLRSQLVAPHAFIRQVNEAYDLGIHVDAMLACAPGDDLGLAAGSGPDERWVLMERLDWDSKFFGRGMARLNAVVAPAGQPGRRADVAADVAAIRESLAQAARAGVGYVICTTPSTDLAQIRALCGSGFDLIETRCHYHMPLMGPPGVRYPVRLATSEDIPSLSKAASQTINEFDRFHADPEIPPKDADRLMERWVVASINEGFAEATIVPDEPAPEAFCTVRYHRRHWDGWGLQLAQTVLSVVAPRHRGWYVKIMSELNEHLRTTGAEHAFVITQATNKAVIHSLEKLGYKYGKTEHVFRHVSK